MQTRGQSVLLLPNSDLAGRYWESDQQSGEKRLYVSESLEGGQGVHPRNDENAAKNDS